MLILPARTQRDGYTLRIVLPISPATGVWSITENDPAFLAPRGTVLPTAPASVGQSEVLLFSAVKGHGVSET